MINVDIYFFICIFYKNRNNTLPLYNFTLDKDISPVEHYKTIDVKSYFKIFESRELGSTIL